MGMLRQCAAFDVSCRCLHPGDVVCGKYLVGECIGYGSMGLVFEATHLDLDRRVALKCVRPELVAEPEMEERFLAEARLCANLRSEHTAHVLDFGRLESGIPFLVMERLEGHDVKAELARSGPFSVERAVDCVLEACEALAEAHAHDIVHRDIKPENLFLADHVERGKIVKVLDFGISKHAGMTEHGRERVGSPAYMSPEQIDDSGSVDSRSDVWSLGVVLFELSSGTLPFDGETWAELRARILYDDPRSLASCRPEVPPALEAVVYACLEKSRERRVSSVIALGRALAPFASAASTSVPALERITVHSSDPRATERPVISPFAETLPSLTLLG